MPSTFRTSPSRPICSIASVRAPMRCRRSSRSRVRPMSTKVLGRTGFCHWCCHWEIGFPVTV